MKGLGRDKGHLEITPGQPECRRWDRPKLQLPRCPGARKPRLQPRGALWRMSQGPGPQTWAGGTRDRGQRSEQWRTERIGHADDSNDSERGAAAAEVGEPKVCV